MSASPIEVVGQWMQNLLDPDVVHNLVALRCDVQDHRGAPVREPTAPEHRESRESVF